MDAQLTNAPLGLSHTAQKPVSTWGKAARATIWCSRADCSFIRPRSPAAQRPAARPAAWRYWTAWSPPPCSRWAGCCRPAPDRPAFGTALCSSSSIAPGARIIKGGETTDEEWR
ncbi:hypothetical protein GCM10010341_33120 [Streptomyces noursei]|nr:hypothetical protein GCM10010341_33120 [Streptomyces noursei]